MPHWLAPTITITPSASSRPGKASSVSLKAMSTRSVQPRTKPATTPTTRPTAVASATVSSAMRQLVEAARMARLATSRPNSSVPSQCAIDGGCSLPRRSMPSGL
ncbi:hypothetical protein D9M68_670290 [compost metagenome]